MSATAIKRAAQSGVADPIFEAIAEHRRLFDAVEEAGAISDSLASDADDAMGCCELRLASLQPTTPAGVAAILDTGTSSRQGATPSFWTERIPSTNGMT
jgi:hypothetical protein